MNLQEISIREFESIQIGQTENAAAGTGCTVFLCPEGMRAGADVRGGGPASRESELLKPLAAAQVVHAVVLAGGSAFGLGTANGVMEFLEERDIGFDVGVTKVPLVVQADLFDLTVGDMGVRPGPEMGREATRLALEAPNYQDGNYGAGCGATVGKLGGMETCMKSGIGSYAVQLGDLKVGAVVAVNALGDVYDRKTGKMIAGMLNNDRTGFASTLDMMTAQVTNTENQFVRQELPGNTTLAVILTNADLDKTQLCKAAGMAHDGMARSICPIHTSADGDTIFAVSAGENFSAAEGPQFVKADTDLVGVLAAEVLSEAITRAVMSAESAYGFPAAKDLYV